jgi:hypothetical protein
MLKNISPACCWVREFPLGFYPGQGGP